MQAFVCFVEILEQYIYLHFAQIVLTFESGTIFILRRSILLLYFIIFEIRKYLNSLCFKRPGGDQLWYFQYIPTLLFLVFSRLFIPSVVNVPTVTRFPSFILAFMLLTFWVLLFFKSHLFLELPPLLVSLLWLASLVFLAFTLRLAVLLLFRFC